MTSTVRSVDALSTTTTSASASCDTDCKVAAMVDDELCVTMTAATVDTPDGPGTRALSTGDRARGSRRTRRRRLRRQHLVAARATDDPLARAVRTARRPPGHRPADRRRLPALLVPAIDERDRGGVL